MDLKQYRVKIANKLLGNLQAQVEKEKAIEEGTYHGRRGVPYQPPRHTAPLSKPTITMPSGHVDTTPNDDGYSSDDMYSDVDIGGSFIGKEVVKKTPRRGKTKKTVPQPPPSTDSESEDGTEEVHGGKFHFVKSMKKFGNDFGNSLKKAGIQAATKEIANEGVKFAKNNISKLVNGAEQVLPEALPVAEEVAPLALAAGMKKPKRTRKVSEKEANRHALIRKLMQKHGCTLAEASKHIKENNLSY